MEDTAARRNSWFSRSRPRAQLSCSTPQSLLALLSHTLTPLRSPRLASIPVRSRPPSFSRRHCGTRYWNPGNCELAEQTPPSGTPNSVHPRPADTCEPAFPPRLCSGTNRRLFPWTRQKSHSWLAKGVAVANHTTNRKRRPQLVHTRHGRAGPVSYKCQRKPTAYSRARAPAWKEHPDSRAAQRGYKVDQGGQFLVSPTSLRPAYFVDLLPAFRPRTDGRKPGFRRRASEIYVANPIPSRKIGQNLSYLLPARPHPPDWLETKNQCHNFYRIPSCI